MREINYNSLAEFLKTGREIEFAYNQKNYSITNHSGFWYLCCDTDDTLLDTVCRFEEKAFTRRARDRTSCTRLSYTIWCIVHPLYLILFFALCVYTCKRHKR